MKIQPLSNYLLIENLPETTTPSGLAVVGGQDYRTGRVVNKGTGRYDNGALVPIPVEIGDTVLYSPDRYGVYRVGEHLLIDAGELLAVVKQD